MVDDKYRVFNANYSIKFKVDDEQKEKFNKYWTNKMGENFYFEKIFSRIDDDGYVETQLWHFMLYFGPLIRLGYNPPFNLDILIDTSYLEKIAK